MGVLIKGMEMPYGCADCDFCGGIIMPDGIYYCDCPAEASHGKNISDAINNGARADFCPLVEIPTPHGRLIDADKFKADHSMKNDCAECEKELQGSSRACEYDRIYSKMDFCGWLDDADVVIEAEGSEE